MPVSHGQAEDPLAIHSEHTAQVTIRLGDVTTSREGDELRLRARSHRSAQDAVLMLHTVALDLFDALHMGAPESPDART